MISLKTVFNYIKFANELTNKVSFMFNGIKKYVAKCSCVIMLLLVQFDVCAPLIDANLAMVETMEQPTLPSDNNEENRGENLLFPVGTCTTANSRFYLHYHVLVNLFAIPKFRYKVTHLSVKSFQESGTSSHYLLCVPHLICHIKAYSYILA